MPRFGKTSRRRLATCHPDLVRLMKATVRIVDITIVSGHRGRKAQNYAFERGQSKVKWPNGRHNSKPSEAVDWAPWPVDWENRERFLFVAGIVQGIASAMGIPIRGGVDWNGNFDPGDDGWDPGHTELG